MRHNPAFVRINPFDGTLHCERHGLLNADEAREAMTAARLTAAIAATTHTPRLLAVLLDRWGKFRHGEACEP